MPPTDPIRQRSTGRRGGAHVATYVALLAVAVLWLFPLLWMVAVALKPDAEIFRPNLVPRAPTFGPFQAVFQSEGFDFPLYARNTLLVVVLSLIGTLVSSAIAAYGFARLRFPGRDLLFGICLATMMLPFPVIMAPQYMIFQKLGWIGTLAPLWAPSWFGAAFNIFLLRQFFRGIPQELEESAMLDGCSRWGCFWRIIVPLSVPALAVVALFHTLAVWNDLVGPLIYLSHQDQYTLALGLQFLQARSGDTPWNQLMAAATLVSLPVLILFLFTQKTFIRGIATSGLKE